MARAPIFPVLVQAAVDTTVFARAMVPVRLLCTREAVDVALSNDDLFLPIVDRIDLVLGALGQLAYLADHHLQLQDVIVRLLVDLMQLLDLLLHCLFARERAQLPINALNVQLAAKVGDLLVPELDHVEDSLVEALCLATDQVLEVLLRLLVRRECLRKCLVVELGEHKLLDF